jgi:hypothetical protein
MLYAANLKECYRLGNGCLSLGPLPLDAFNKRTSVLDGLSSWCRECEKSDKLQKYGVDPKRNQARALAQDERERQEALFHKELKNCSRGRECSQSNPLPLEAFNGNKSRPDGLQSQCRACQSLSGKAYHDAYPETRSAYAEKNREALSKQRAAYRRDNLEMFAERGRTRYLANRERILKEQAAWRRANPEKKSKTDKAYRQANLEKLKKLGAEYYQKNKEKYAEYDILARYRRTPEQTATQTAIQEGVCQICWIAPCVENDHDHKCCDDTPTCGECVRGLLCRRCNISLAHLEAGRRGFRNNPVLRERAEEYIRVWNIIIIARRLVAADSLRRSG